MARMNIKKAYKKNFMLAKVLYEDGFFTPDHVSKHLKNYYVSVQFYCH